MLATTLANGFRKPPLSICCCRERHTLAVLRITSITWGNCGFYKLFMDDLVWDCFLESALRGYSLKKVGLPILWNSSSLDESHESRELSVLVCLDISFYCLSRLIVRFISFFSFFGRFCFWVILVARTCIFSPVIWICWCFFYLRISEWSRLNSSLSS